MPEIWEEGGGTALVGTTLPPEVLLVWDPWPLASFGLGPLQRPVPSVVAQSNELSSLFGAPPTPWPHDASLAKEG